jgi:dipeptidyl aminopeptidase/acylaminoacyl peptidase
MSGRPETNDRQGASDTAGTGGRQHVEHLRLRGGPSGLVLAATLYLPADAHPGGPLLPGLVVGHGAGSNRLRHEPFCRLACSQGFAVLSFDFRGHGESGGELDGPLEQDVLAATALLRSHALVDGERVGYRGSSMGGYYGLRAAHEARFSALALLCPATDDVLLAGVQRRQGRGSHEEGGLEMRYDADKARSYFSSRDIYRDAEYVTAPVLLVHARGDDVVPLDRSLRLAAALEGPVELLILPGGSHTSAQATPEVARRVVDWLAEQLG